MKYLSAIIFSFSLATVSAQVKFSVVCNQNQNKLEIAVSDNELPHQKVIKNQFPNQRLAEEYIVKNAGNIQCGIAPKSVLKPQEPISTSSKNEIDLIHKEDSRSGNINQRNEPFDSAPNETTKLSLQGIWENKNIALQIDGSKASLFQTTDINYWQNYNIDKGGLILKNIQKNGNNKWQCDVMWLFPNTPYKLWMTGNIEMNSDGSSITIIKKSPCDGHLGYQTLNRRLP